MRAVVVFRSRAVFTFVRINFINLQRVIFVPGMMGPKLDLMIGVVIVLPELWWCLLGTCWVELLLFAR
jgi:hypothetical protein